MAKGVGVAQTDASRARAHAVERERTPVDGADRGRPNDPRAPDETERELGRWIGRGLPVLTIVVAIGVGVASSIGPALLIVASGTILGTIALFWASIRTLAGEAPLPEALEAVAARRHSVDASAERKAMILRALKDLEHEHFIGKIDDADYEQIAATYRDQVKQLMREMDADIEPLRDRAEAIVKRYFETRGLAAGAPGASGASDAVDAIDTTSEPPRESEAAKRAPGAGRVPCAKCATSNERDAAFCKKCGAPVSPQPTDGSDASDASE